MKKWYQFTTQNGEVWVVPVHVIAMNRAEYYADEFDGSVERSMAEDTVPLFEDDAEVEDWAQNNMNWEDVAADARKVGNADRVDMQESWVNPVEVEMIP